MFLNEPRAGAVRRAPLRWIGTVARPGIRLIWARLDAMTEEEALAAAQSDPNALRRCWFDFGCTILQLHPPLFIVREAA